MSKLSVAYVVIPEHLKGMIELKKFQTPYSDTVRLEKSHAYSEAYL